MYKNSGSIDEQIDKNTQRDPDIQYDDHQFGIEQADYLGSKSGDENIYNRPHRTGDRYNKKCQKKQ